MNNSKQLLKATIILVLIALLLIPTWFITNLVKERKTRKQEITKEVAANWAKQQTITTPYLQVFYNKNSANTAPSTITAKGYIMPLHNKTNNTVRTETLKRSIYKIPVYTASIKMDGTFKKEDIDNFKTTYGTINWQNSFLAINITDARGLADSATVIVNGKSYNLTVSNIIGLSNVKSLAIPLQMLSEIATTDIAYTINLLLKGTERLSFVPLAMNNDITINANWKDPSFEGQSAVDKTITKDGFIANWKINGNSLSIPKISDTWVETNNLAFV